MAAFSEDRVKQIIVDQLGVAPEQELPRRRVHRRSRSRLARHGGAGHVLEEAFDIEIPDEDAEKMTTVADAIKYLESHVAKNA